MPNKFPPVLRPFFCVALVLFAGALVAAASAAAPAPAPDSAAIEAQAQALLAKLSPEEKIELLGGIDSIFTRAMPAIGLPRLKMSDASVGVRVWGPSTSYAGGVSLAATWDRTYARKLGESLGKAARARAAHTARAPR